MRRAPTTILNERQRSQLQSWCRGRSTPFRIVIRSWIVLLAASGKSDREICRILRTNPITVARWRSRFALFGTDGIRTEAPHGGSPLPLSEEVVQAIVRKTLEGASRGNRWSSRSLARELGVSHTTVERVWRRHEIHRKSIHAVRLSTKLRPRPGLTGLAGVYVNPPQRAVALVFDQGGRSYRPQGSPRARPASFRHPEPWIMDLIGGLDALERHELRHDSRRFVEAELVTFFRSIGEPARGEDHLLVLVESSMPSLPVPLGRWLRRHPRVTVQLCPGTDAWKRTLFERVQGRRGMTVPGAAPDGLSDFLNAVEAWKRSSGGSHSTFAWSRAVSGAAR